MVLLEEKLAYSDKRSDLLERCVDDNEQYGRRTSLHINGISSNVNETSEQCLMKVKDEVCKIVGSQLDDRDFDRVHRVGKPIDREGNPVTKPRFYIDQTHRRFKLRKMAVEYVETKAHVTFGFVDINYKSSFNKWSVEILQFGRGTNKTVKWTLLPFSC